MSMHPYEKADSVDLYYTELANKIYHALDNACFTHQFKDVRDAKYLALCLAGYFEDTISGTCIWKTFTTECKKRYGVYVPFYQRGLIHRISVVDKQDNILNKYDQDYINIADIKFILWHHYQQSVIGSGETVPPLFGPLEAAAKTVYDVLYEEYETAPENERLYEFLCTQPTSEDDFYKYRNVLEWFHYGCYFNVGNGKRLAYAMQWLANTGNYNELTVYTARIEQAMNDRANLLALTSPEWLAKISESHPAHKLWTDVEYRGNRFFTVKRDDEKFVYLKDLYAKDTIKADKRSMAPDNYADMVGDKKVLNTNMFRFGSAWWQNGAMSVSENNKDVKKLVDEQADLLNHKQSLHYYNLLKDNGYGSLFLFADSPKMVKEFCKSIGYDLPADFRIPSAAGEGIIISGSPYSGINITVGLAQCISSPDNPYYNSEKAEERCFDIVCGRGNAFPYEIVCRLIAGGMLPDANAFPSKYIKEVGRQITLENLQFLADYYLMARKDKDISPEELW